MTDGQVVLVMGSNMTMSAPTSSLLPEPSSRATILVVDDDDSVRSGLRSVLMTEGYAVVTANNGFQATAAVRSQACALALVDMNMPLLNGWGAIANLRSLAPTLPIVIITARPDQRTVAREAGVTLMEKPLDLPLLLQTIGELVSRQASPVSQTPEKTTPS
jgi:DNA-binding response OmpR family regulator